MRNGKKIFVCSLCWWDAWKGGPSTTQAIESNHGWETGRTSFPYARVDWQKSCDSSNAILFTHTLLCLSTHYFVVPQAQIGFGFWSVTGAMDFAIIKFCAKIILRSLPQYFIPTPLPPPPSHVIFKWTAGCTREKRNPCTSRRRMDHDWTPMYIRARRGKTPNTKRKIERRPGLRSRIKERENNRKMGYIS